MRTLRHHSRKTTARKPKLSAPASNEVLMKRLIMVLLHSATNAHILHLQTKSYAEHVALGAYYEGIVGPVDSLVENMQGMAGEIIRGYPLENSAFDESMSGLAYMTRIRELFLEHRPAFPASASQIQNILDTILELINSTIYKLKFLH